MIKWGWLCWLRLTCTQWHRRGRWWGCPPQAWTPPRQTGFLALHLNIVKMMLWTTWTDQAHQAVCWPQKRAGWCGSALWRRRRPRGTWRQRTTDRGQLPACKSGSIYHPDRKEFNPISRNHGRPTWVHLVVLSRIAMSIMRREGMM